jgi:hypothetical protein
VVGLKGRKREGENLGRLNSFISLREKIEGLGVYNTFSVWNIQNWNCRCRFFKKIEIEL